MREPIWLEFRDVVDLHAELLARFGGRDSDCNSRVLEIVSSRPVDRWRSSDTALASLAAAYAFGIAKHHPFIDGNKRAAFAAIIVFLGLNDGEFLVSEAHAAAIILARAAGEVGEESLTRWIRDNWPKVA